MPSLSPLASPSATRAVLEAHGLAAKKALGQNFLVNDGVLQKIVALADVGPQDVVLEVGPGIGTLTIALLKHAARVVSVERDADLPAVLADTCAPWADRFALVEKDALALAEDDVRAALAGVATSLVERADKAGELVCRFGAPSGKPDVIVGGSIGEAGASVNASGLVGMGIFFLGWPLLFYSYDHDSVIQLFVLLNLFFRQGNKLLLAQSDEKERPTDNVIGQSVSIHQRAVEGEVKPLSAGIEYDGDRIRKRVCGFDITAHDLLHIFQSADLPHAAGLHGFHN